MLQCESVVETALDPAHEDRPVAEQDSPDGTEDREAHLLVEDEEGRRAAEQVHPLGPERVLLVATDGVGASGEEPVLLEEGRADPLRDLPAGRGGEDDPAHGHVDELLDEELADREVRAETLVPVLQARRGEVAAARVDEVVPAVEEARSR